MLLDRHGRTIATPPANPVGARPSNGMGPCERCGKIDSPRHWQMIQPHPLVKDAVIKMGCLCENCEAEYRQLGMTYFAKVG